MKKTEELLQSFSSITLKEMEKERLMNRIDTKYTTCKSQLYNLLSQMQNLYYVQEIEGKRISPYQTVYLDTKALDMFRIHQTGRRTREKIRIRKYIDSHLTFLEIKDKNNKGRTSKVRIPVSDIQFLDEKGEEFIRAYGRYNPEELTPHIQNHFQRITLVNKQLTERLTIDIGLRFQNLATSATYELPEMIIIELKQDGRQYSTTKRLLSDLHIRSVSISKYCLGCILTNPSVKYNRFKNRIRQINKQINRSTIWMQ